jgi:hypothetical protein
MLLSASPKNIYGHLAEKRPEIVNFLDATCGKLAVILVWYEQSKFLLYWSSFSGGRSLIHPTGVQHLEPHSHAADMVVATGTARDPGHAHAVSQQPRTLPAEDEADEKTVTESN